VWAPRAGSERPGSADGPASVRTTLLLMALALVGLAGVVFVYLVLAAPK
jgi:hypothetical protein